MPSYHSYFTHLRDNVFEAYNYLNTFILGLENMLCLTVDYNPSAATNSTIPILDDGAGASYMRHMCTRFTGGSASTDKTFLYEEDPTGVNPTFIRYVRSDFTDADDDAGGSLQVTIEHEFNNSGARIWDAERAVWANIWDGTTLTLAGTGQYRQYKDSNTWNSSTHLIDLTLWPVWIGTMSGNSTFTIQDAPPGFQGVMKITPATYTPTWNNVTFTGGGSWSTSSTNYVVFTMSSHNATGYGWHAEIYQ